MAEGFISTVEEIAALRNRLSEEGRKLVLTNGAFDLLHLGHVRYLGEAAGLGDVLVVAINGDESVRELKGPGRPINSAEDRAEMLCALESVDHVVVFDERRASTIIEAIRPHIYTKGGDYTPESLIDEEKALLDRLGIDIRILSLVPGKSTTDTLATLSEDPVSAKKVAILGSGKGSNARSLLDASGRGELGGEVALVMCDVPDAGILEVAADHEVPAIVIDPGTEKPGQLTDAALKEIQDRLRAARIDLVVLAGFMRILRDPVLSAYEGRILNIHPSLLPRFAGLHAVRRAVEEGEMETGCTIHLVDRGVDTGKILRQERLEIREGESIEALHDRIHELEHAAYPEVVAEQLARLP
jgi:formyltetrahydrofolate-dependent phosphoribosylglycinamide formyltransferase